MTSQKSLKSKVRGRMGKTGESYTAARRQVLRRNDRVQVPPAASEAAASAEPPAVPVRALRLSEQSLKESTGRGWDEWFGLLDEWGASLRKHGEIARWLLEEHHVPGWWAQGITVSYEQARGMRVPGQNSTGAFYGTASRTIAVPVAELFAAFADEGVRRQWLPDVTLRVRTATEFRSFRADWDEDGTRIAVGFDAKGDAKSMVTVSHEKLVDSEDAAQRKAFWRERLGALKKLLEGPS